jgi:hypothetical protein
MGGRSLSKTVIVLAGVALVVATASTLLLRGQDASTAAVVPIEFAITRGASAWDTQHKERFLQDEENQWPMSEIQQKARGARGPLHWLPALEQCRYISRFMDIAKRYGLDDAPAEMQQLRSQRQRCYTQFQ